MEIIENFLAQQNLDQLKISIFSEKFPWYYVDYVANPVDDKNFYFKRFFYSFVLYISTPLPIISITLIFS